MARITIEIDIADEYADEDDSTGVTEEGYDLIIDALSAIAESISVYPT